MPHQIDRNKREKYEHQIKWKTASLHIGHKRNTRGCYVSQQWLDYFDDERKLVGRYYFKSILRKFTIDENGHFPLGCVEIVSNIQYFVREKHSERFPRKCKKY